MHVLDSIVERKRDEVRRLRARMGRIDFARELPLSDRDFAGALRGLSGPAVIAEVKRASPSRGVLRPELPVAEWSPVSLAQAYESAGAAALSVLTDVSYFWGSLDYIEACREATTLPVLRKDFVIDPIQVDEARAYGADAVLLIVRLLDRSQLVDFGARARELGMDVLVEVHADRELDDALAVEGAIIGVNHRDLDTLEIDMERSVRLKPRIPPAQIGVAESGVSTRDSIKRLQSAGYSAFLVGEHLAAKADPKGALRELLRP